MIFFTFIHCLGYMWNLSIYQSRSYICVMHNDDDGWRSPLLGMHNGGAVCLWMDHWIHLEGTQFLATLFSDDYDGLARWWCPSSEWRSQSVGVVDPRPRMDAIANAHGSMTRRATGHCAAVADSVASARPASKKDAKVVLFMRASACHWSG